jgi:glycosyltransferase involved in cell wall biosynthesis
MVNGTGVYAMELLRHLPPSVQATALVAREEQRAALDAIGIRTVENLAGCDVFHRPSQIYDRPTLDLFLRSPVPAVVTCHDLISYRTPAIFGSFDLYRQYRGLLFAALQAADAVIALSAHARSEILDEFGLPEHRVHRVPNGVDAARFRARDRASNAEVLRRHGVAAPYFLCGGSDYPHKNVGLLLRGYAWLRAQWRGPQPVPELVLTGPRNGVPGGIFELGRDPAPGVRYLGAVDRAEVPALYQEALASVSPSSYEGFGLPLLEAMAAGTPVLCARLTSMPEVAGDAALYLEELSIDEIAERMRTLASDAALRQRLVEAGRKRVRSFSWKETARRTAEVYAAVAENPSADAALHRRALLAIATSE